MHYMAYAIIPKSKLRKSGQPKRFISALLRPYCVYVAEQGKGEWDYYRIGGIFDGVLVGRPHKAKDDSEFSRARETIKNNSINVDLLDDPLPSELRPAAIFAPEGAWFSWTHAATNAQELRRIIDKYRGGKFVAVALDCHV